MPDQDLSALEGAGRLVTVAVCQDALSARLLQGRLQTEGIPAFVADIATAQAYPLASLAFGGPRVQVPAGRVHAARQVLARLEAGDFALDSEEPD